MISRILRLLAAAALAVGMLIVTPAAANALGPDCKDAPRPEAPGRGITGAFVDAPKDLPAGESWQNGRPVYSHYAYAGYRWNTYDLGCGADIARNPGAVVGTEVANWLYEVPKFGVALTNFAIRTAYNPTFLDVFNPLVLNASEALRRALFDQWVGVFVLLLGATLLWRARALQLSSAATMAVWAVLVMILVAAVAQWPLRAGEITDDVVTSTLGSVNRGINGSTGGVDPADQAAQNLTSAVLFEQWKAGQFGDANSATANKYARAMWESQTLTWAEARTVSEDPDGRGKDLIEDKAKLYEDTAEKIKNEDPDAYAYLQGIRSSDRLGTAFIALFAAAVACPFLLMSSVLILAAYLIVRLAVIFLPAVATLGVAWQFRGMVKGLLNVVAAAVINCIVFGVGCAVAIYGIGILLSPTNGLAQALRLVMVALLTFIMWHLLRPFRRLTTMVSANHNVFGSAAGALGDTGRSGLQQVKGLARTALASYVGNTVADRQQEKREQKEKTRAEQNTVTVERTHVAEEATSEPPTTGPAEPPSALTMGPRVAGALGTRPAHTERPPYERPAARTSQPVDAAPVPQQVTTRPAHTEVGPYAATATGGAVEPTVLPPVPPGIDTTPVAERPEYPGGGPRIATDQPNSREQEPPVSVPADHPAEDGPVRVAEPQVSEDGELVYMVWRPDTGPIGVPATAAPEPTDAADQPRAERSGEQQS